VTLASAQVKYALAARIIGLPSTAERVFKSRAWPLTEADLPAWKVVTQAEEISVLTLHDPVLQAHALRVDFQGVAKAVDLLDDALDALASEVCTRLFNPPAESDALSALEDRLQLTLTGIDRDLAGEGEAALGVVTVTLLAEFRTVRNDPDNIVS